MKSIKIFIILLLMAFGSFAQRHINNSTAVELLAGSLNYKTPESISLYWSKFKKKSYIKFGGTYQNQIVKVSGNDILVENIEGEAIWNKGIMSNNRNIFITAPLGAFGGYELINKGYENINNYKIVTKSAFSYGLSAGIEAELYFSAKVALVANYRAKVYISDNSYKILTPVHVGLKFIKF